MITIDALLNLRLDIFWDARAAHDLAGDYAGLLVVGLADACDALLDAGDHAPGLYHHGALQGRLPERNVINKHALPNALMPVVTLGGATVVGLLGGVVIVETVFNYPGIGSAFAAAAVQLWM